MKLFTIAFPLPVELPDAAAFLSEKLSVDLSKGQILFPGTSFFCTPVLQGAAPGLEKLFDEHERLSAEDSARIQGHGSLFFLQFSLKGFADFKDFLAVAGKILDAGAVGVYVENSGAAFCAGTFKSLVSGDAPMEAFVNFIENAGALFTLGLEPFGLPDFCLKIQDPLTEDSGREVLLSAASAFFESGEGCASGSVWESDGESFDIRQEFKAPYSKGCAEWNAFGYRRFVLRTK